MKAHPWPGVPRRSTMGALMAQDDAIVRLARQIDAARKAEELVVNGPALAALRRQGACELHAICAEFVSALNRRLPAAVELTPALYVPAMFRESGVNLMQISSQGRQMQIAFEAPPQDVST